MFVLPYVAVGGDDVYESRELSTSNGTYPLCDAAAAHKRLTRQRISTLYRPADYRTRTSAVSFGRLSGLRVFGCECRQPGESSHRRNVREGNEAREEPRGETHVNYLLYDIYSNGKRNSASTCTPKLVVLEFCP